MNGEKMKINSLQSKSLSVGLILMLLLAMMVIPSLAQDGEESLIYSEDFENGEPAEIYLEEGWVVQPSEDGNGHVLAGSGHTWAHLWGAENLYNFRLRMKVQLVNNASLHVNLRKRDGPTRYFFGMESGFTYLSKQSGEKFEELVGNLPDVGPGWHTIEIILQEAQITARVDNNLIFQYEDPDPLLSGSVSFESENDGPVLIDDIEIYTKVAPRPTASIGREWVDTWVRMGGPLGGIGYDIRMRPDNPDIMYVSDAVAGVHMSTDGGQTWFPTNEGIDIRAGESGDAIPVFSLTIDPHNPDILWIGTQAQLGIYKSIDGGQTWQLKDNGVVEKDITFRGFTVDPRSSDIIYAAAEVSSWEWTEDGQELMGVAFDRTMGVVYRTQDGGEHWEEFWRGNNLARYVWVNPQDPNVIYISTGIFDREAANSDPVSRTPGGEGILKTTDGGQTWQQVNNGLHNLYVGSLYMHPKDPQILLAGVSNNTYPDDGGIYLTKDGGESWMHQGGWAIQSVEFSESDPNIAYALGAGEVYRSADGGETWKALLNENEIWGPPGVRPGFPIDIQIDPRDPERIFANNYGGGNFLSEDGGKTWVVASTGYTGALLRSVSVDQNNPAVVFATGRSGPYRSTDGGHNWTGINMKAPPEIVEGSQIEIDPADSTHLLMSSEHWGLTYESHDSGASWSLVTDFGQQLMNLPEGSDVEVLEGMRAIEFAPSDPNKVYGAFGNQWESRLRMLHTVFLSNDGGKNWRIQEGTPLDGLSVIDITVHPLEADTAWMAAPRGGVFRTQDGGKSWTPDASGLKDKMPISLLVIPNNPNILLTGTYGNEILRSLDSGVTWERFGVGMDPNQTVTALVADPEDDSILYAGTNRSGVYISQDQGQTWRQINNGLRMRTIQDLAISADGQTVYAATDGEGVFRLSALTQEEFDDLYHEADATEIKPQAETQEQDQAPAEPTSPSESDTADAPVEPPETTGRVFKNCPLGLLPAGAVVLVGWQKHRKGK
jgi:photosystem II stability/assembly factor-like uncharacterized protein